MPLLLSLLALLVLPTALADAGPSKAFDKHGFKWSLPDDWAFLPVSPQDVSGGFVAKAECQLATIEVWVYAAATNDLSLAERVKEIIGEGAGGFGAVNQRKVLDSSISGVKGKVVIQKIKADGGSMGHFRTYVIASGGKFYQLLLRAWHGSEEGEADGINAMRAGFRLLKGAGGEDKPETMTEFGSSKDSEGDEDGADDDGGTNGGASDDDWNPKGAKKEGRKICLPSHNVEWTLPEGPFRWTDAPTNETEKHGLFAVAMARVEREAKQDYEKDRPPSLVRIDFYIEDVWPGLKVNNWVKGMPDQGVTLKSAQEHVKGWKIFSEPQSGKTRTYEGAKIGNVKGAILKMEGKQGDQHKMLLLFTAIIRDKWYRIHATAVGASDVYKHMRKAIGKAVKGIEFLETSEMQRGPLLGAIPDFAWHRGEKADKEREYKGPGYTFKKPKGMAYVKVRDAMNRDIRFTGEMRNKEGDAYLYFEIRTFKLNIPRKPNPKPEKFINDRAEDWAAGAGENAYVGRKKGELGKKGKFSTGKGRIYKFTGDLMGVPYVEEGFVVKHKSNLFFIKFQYGGVDAQKKLKSLAKKVKKGFKFNK